jgi:predicted AlkP superfamily pyrophosphatase or phosphodiesterase
MRGIDDLGLSSRTTYVVVSDHGMATTSNDRLIYLDDYLSTDDINVVEWSPNVAINPQPTTTVDSIYSRLFNKHPALAVYKREELPKWLQFGTNRRIPPILGIAELGWVITTHARAESVLKTASGFAGYTGCLSQPDRVLDAA